MTLPSSINTIFFDADDTLYSIRGSIGERYAPHFNKYGYEISPEKLNTVVWDCWKGITGTYENKENDYICNHDRDMRVWKEFVSLVTASFSEINPSTELFESIYEDFATANSRTLEPGIVDLLSFLTSKGFTLGVFTNNDKRIHRLLPDLGIAKYFKQIYCASDVGYKKPSPKGFEFIAHSLDEDPSKMLYVGDAFEIDVVGAQSAGWHAAHYCPKNRPKGSTSPKTEDISRENLSYITISDFLDFKASI